MQDKYVIVKYLRLSLEDGDCPESDSIKNQRTLLDSHIRKLVNYCEKNRFEIVAIKSEVGRGKCYFRTPLNIAISNKEAEAIVITDLSRFSRNIPLGLQLLSRVYDNNKFLIGADCDKVIDSSIEHTMRVSSFFE